MCLTHMCTQVQTALSVTNATSYIIRTIESLLWAYLRETIPTMLVWFLLLLCLPHLHLWNAAIERFIHNTERGLFICIEPPKHKRLTRKPVLPKKVYFTTNLSSWNIVDFRILKEFLINKVGF